jgi:hypothetical protein
MCWNIFSGNDLPLHTHYGRDYVRILFTVILTIIGFLSIVLFRIVGYPGLSILLAAAFGIVCIRYPRIYVFSDRVEIVKWCMIRKFTDRDCFHYQNIRNVEFLKGYTNWPKLLLLASMGRGSGGGTDRVSKADEMKITTNDQKVHHFHKFGKKNAFIFTIELLQNRIESTVS